MERDVGRGMVPYGSSALVDYLDRDDAALSYTESHGDEQAVTVPLGLFEVCRGRCGGPGLSISTPTRRARRLPGTDGVAMGHHSPAVAHTPTVTRLLTERSHSNGPGTGLPVRPAPETNVRPVFGRRQRNVI